MNYDPNRVVTLVTQPTPKTCCHACLSMVSGVPVDELVEKFGNDGMSEQEFIEAISDLGLSWNKFCFNTMFADGTYSVTVPSLNIDGGLHKIVIIIVDGIWTVLDPNNGLDGKLYYGFDGCPLRSWGEVYFFG
jgi:hypothetical protein